MAYYSDYCNKPSAVYRIYDVAGLLLYVGMSLRPDTRVMVHGYKQPWGKQIDTYSVEWFPGRDKALLAERSAIHHENPLYNLARPRMECC